MGKRGRSAGRSEAQNKHPKAEAGRHKSKVRGEEEEGKLWLVQIISGKTSQLALTPSENACLFWRTFLCLALRNSRFVQGLKIRNGKKLHSCCTLLVLHPHYLPLGEGSFQNGIFERCPPNDLFSSTCAQEKPLL